MGAEGRMPAEYDAGLEQSKLIMRAYVYGASPVAIAALRARVPSRHRYPKGRETPRTNSIGHPLSPTWALRVTFRLLLVASR